ncbi:sodium:solute symporter [Cyanobium sp. WAJ14-Wanaka]|uniref:sodium:solute symporter n=1 Tax=Cyanobium sp. WAJ14-Wanaka TaxID=2823725 RepID=UPI0020CBA9B5|nr:sodium:solute symporter [Cyanobium sp. WAJ14-Wanaka]MCP9776134.1 sodium:solute symporter [Cyanobium sp. WAJ14-Wanaka]
MNADLLELGLSGVVLGALVLLGRSLGEASGMQRIGLPSALLSGLIGLLIGPYGPVHWLPAGLTERWIPFPEVLMTLVFSTMLLGKPLPSAGSLWRPATAQLLLGLTLGFGQYLMGGLVVLGLLIPWLGVHPLMACLIEVGFEGGHGSAAVMGPIYAQWGFLGGRDLGLAMATVGLVSSVVVGSLLVILARSRGWLAESESAPEPTPLAPKTPAIAEQTWFRGLERLATNLGCCGLAVLLALALQRLLLVITPNISGGLTEVVRIMPLFPLALLGSLLVQGLLERSGQSGLATPRPQAQTASLATDLLITGAMAGLNLPLLLHDWLPLAVLAGVGLAWNLLGLLLLAPRILPSPWFERGITEFGQATGVAASGLLLLGLADPEGDSNTLAPFSFKQLAMQPILAGGVITVVAPLAVESIGLPTWTGLCLAITLSFALGGLLLARSASSPSGQ